MKYQLNIEFHEETPKEQIEYLLASLKWRKKLDAVGGEFLVENATLHVVDEEPDWYAVTAPEEPFVPDHLQ